MYSSITMTLMTTVTTKGQVTIPSYFREKLKLRSGSLIAFKSAPDTETLILRPIPDFADLRGIFKTKKRFSKRLARAAYIKDLIAGKI